MVFFDAHCDILREINKPDELFSNNHHWDTERALRNGPFIQTFSLFHESADPLEKKLKMESQLEKLLEAEKNRPEKLKMIHTAPDLEECTNLSSGSKVYGFIEAEGAEILAGSLDELDRLYELGLRILTLSWNYDNDVCDSVAGNSIHNGLSSFGRKVVENAGKLGILIDVSHASDKTFEDVASISESPITASHSNARALCGHRRNLTDEQIKMIAHKSGVIGINLCPSFIESSGNADILNIIKHIEHISALTGTDHVGFGADFDGIDKPPKGIRGVEDLGRIIEALLRMNYPEAAVRDIAGGNFIRLMGRMLRH